MARTLESNAPNSLSAFTVKVIVAGAVTETITMSHVAAEPGTWRGTIAQAGSVGEAKLSYYWNGSSTEAGAFIADISATDGTTSYARDLVKVELPFRNATATQTLSGTTVGTAETIGATGLAAIWNRLTSALSVAGSIGKFIVDSLTGVGLGSGARTVTVTVQTGGAVAIQGARVRMTKGAESFIGITNSSGQVTFNLDDGTWTVAITAAGYTFSGTTLVVDGTETPTYTMTTNTVSSPSAPDRSVGTLLCLGNDELPEPNVVLSVRKTAGPGDAGYSLDSEERLLTSDEDGIVEAEFQIGATYKIRRGVLNTPTTREVEFGPVADAASFNLPEHLGKP